MRGGVARARDLFRRSPAYSVLRSYRSRQQLREFRALVAGLAAEAPPAPTAVSERLAELRSSRRTVAGGRPGVVGFGTREWEQHGLWDSFAAVSDFSLWQYRPPHVHVMRPDAAHRERLARGFLQHVDAVARKRDVHCAFFYASAEHVDLRLIAELQQRGIWTVVMGLDDKHQFIRPVDAATGKALQRSLAESCDVYWTTWRRAAQAVTAGGGVGWYAAEGAHPAFHRPIPVQRDLDVVFIGQAYGARGELVGHLRRCGVRVAAWGAGWPAGFVPFDQAIEVYSRARIVLGFGGVGHTTEVQHLKGRDFEVPMCGALYLTSYNPELADHFVVGEEILCYASRSDAVELALDMLARPDAAQRIREAALRRSLREHTWQGRLTDLLGATTGAGGSVAPAAAAAIQVHGSNPRVVGS
jgi:spore maturation protein CgeB